MLRDRTGFDAETFAHKTFAQCSVYVTSRPGEGGKEANFKVKLFVCSCANTLAGNCVYEGILISEPGVDSRVSNDLAL